MLQIANVCISLDEYPYIRYYMPSHHPPLGALKPNNQTRPPPPPEAASRWRTNLARGATSRTYEDSDNDHATRLLALKVQQYLDEYKRLNTEFPVRLFNTVAFAFYNWFNA
jgi:syntaxin-binding protein 1